jgi:hypothetical protein
MSTKFPLCRICNTRQPGWNIFDLAHDHRGHLPQPHWGLSHLCAPCWRKICIAWTKWAEVDIVAAFPLNRDAVVNAFWLTNRLRKKSNQSRRAKKTRAILNERKVHRYSRTRPMLRQSALRVLGYVV